MGSFPPNLFGLYDMHGNVWEWCADTWHDTYEGAPTDDIPWTDENTESVTKRVLRGGSWITFPDNCRSATRYVNSWRDLFSYSFGFRVICS